jgi:ABC-2 type transport system permease protein
MQFIQIIKKYLGLYKAFFKASLVADLEFRLNFILLVFAEFIWYSTQFFLYEVIYRHTKLIGKPMLLIMVHKEMRKDEVLEFSL